MMSGEYNIKVKKKTIHNKIYIAKTQWKMRVNYSTLLHNLHIQVRVWWLKNFVTSPPTLTIDLQSFSIPVFFKKCF